MEPGAPAVVSSADANSRLALSLPPATDAFAARTNQQAGAQMTALKVLRTGTAGATPSTTDDMLVDGSDDEVLISDIANCT